LDRAFFLERSIDPGRRQPERRFLGVDAGQVHLSACRVHDHVLAGPDAPASSLDLLDLDHIGVGVELNVVEDAHRRHHESHLDCKRAPQRLDLLGEAVAAVGGVDERQQRIAELDLEVVDLERRRDRSSAGAAALAVSAARASAAVPSCPRARIRRVEARLSASRSMVAISSTVGNAENSSGAWMNSAVIRISTEKMIEVASEKSSSSGGSGSSSTIRMVSTPAASAMSPRRSRA